MDQTPGYCPIQGSYINALRHPLTNPELHLEAAQWVMDNPGPCYSCPVCEETLSRSPIKDYHLKQIAESWQEYAGVVYDRDDREGVEGAGMFDKYLLL